MPAVVDVAAAGVRRRRWLRYEARRAIGRGLLVAAVAAVRLLLLIRVIGEL